MCERGYDFAERFHSPAENQTKNITFNNVRIPTKEEIKNILSPLWREAVTKSKYDNVFNNLFPNNK